MNTRPVKRSLTLRVTEPAFLLKMISGRPFAKSRKKNNYQSMFLPLILMQNVNWIQALPLPFDSLFYVTIEAKAASRCHRAL